MLFLQLGVVDTKPNEGSMSNHDKVYENVVDVLIKDGKIATGGLDGLKTVEIIERIYK